MEDIVVRLLSSSSLNYKQPGRLFVYIKIYVFINLKLNINNYIWLICCCILMGYIVLGCLMRFMKLVWILNYIFKMMYELLFELLSKYWHIFYNRDHIV